MFLSYLPKRIDVNVCTGREEGERGGGLVRLIIIFFRLLADLIDRQ